MNVAHQRVLNILAGALFALLGFACYGGAAYFATVAPKPVMGPDSLKLDTRACKQTLSRLGFQVTEHSSELRAQKTNGLENPERLLADASIGMSSCGLPIKRFCMGSGCEPPAVPNGIFFGLATQLTMESVEQGGSR